MIYIALHISIANGWIVMMNRKIFIFNQQIFKWRKSIIIKPSLGLFHVVDLLYYLFGFRVTSTQASNNLNCVVL